jgi:uncharacterized protein (UPF0332 family)
MLQQALDATLDATGRAALAAEISRNVRDLFRLATDHLEFARATDVKYWRQVVSRAYYSSYNASRALRLHDDGIYSTDISDHDKIGKLPSSLPNRALYEVELKVFRADRNVADYDHLATEFDLAKPLSDWLTLADGLLRDARTYLTGRGETL